MTANVTFVWTWPEPYPQPLPPWRDPDHQPHRVGERENPMADQPPTGEPMTDQLTPQETALAATYKAGFTQALTEAALLLTPPPGQLPAASHGPESAYAHGWFNARTEAARTLHEWAEHVDERNEQP